MITACLLHPVAWPFRTVHCPAVSSVRSAQHRPLRRSETGSPSDLPAATRSADTAALWSSSLLSPAAQQCRGLQAANQPLLQAVRMSWSTSCLKNLKWLPCCPHKLKHCNSAKDGKLWPKTSKYAVGKILNKIFKIRSGDNATATLGDVVQETWEDPDGICDRSLDKISYFCAPLPLLGFTWCKNSATSNAGICTDHILHKIILHWWVLNGISYCKRKISCL